MRYTPIDKFGGDLHMRNGAEDGLADRLDSLVHDVGTAALENSKAAPQGLREKMEDVTKDGAAILRKRVASQPIAAITIAMAAGALLVGLLFRQ